MAWDDIELEGRKGFTGDVPIDEFALALKRIAGAYEERFRRKPAVHELFHAFASALAFDSKRFVADPEALPALCFAGDRAPRNNVPGIDFRQFEGAYSDRATPGYYLISRRAGDVDVIKVTTLAATGRTLLCEYEVLDPAIDDASAEHLILCVLLEDFSQNYYRGRSGEIEWVNLHSGGRRRAAYPNP